MKPEDKQLLLQDLCARLPYGVIVHCKGEYNEYHKVEEIDVRDEVIRYFEGMHLHEESIINCFPYLRPLSSMTEEEQRELQSFYPCSFGNQYLDLDKETIELYECSSTMEFDLYDSVQMVDFCKKNHLDCYGLIKKGLALSTEDNNPYKD